jgi:hypothetical protein
LGRAQGKCCSHQRQPHQSLCPRSTQLDYTPRHNNFKTTTSPGHPQCPHHPPYLSNKSSALSHTPSYSKLPDPPCRVTKLTNQTFISSRQQGLRRQKANAKSNEEHWAITETPTTLGEPKWVFEWGPSRPQRHPSRSMLLWRPIDGQTYRRANLAKPCNLQGFARFAR